MAYGKIKADAIIYDNSGSDVEKTIAVLASAASTVSPTFTGDVTLTGGSANVVFDASDNALEFADNAKATFGTGSDLKLFHDGTNSNIWDVGTGSLILNTNGADIQLIADGSENMAKFTDGGSVELYHSNVKKFETSATGCSVTGTATATTIADSKGDVRKIIQNTQGSSYTLVAADAGKHILASGTVTVPNNIMSAGDAVTIVNNTGSNLTITKSISTMYNSADGSSANRTLANRGMATIIFVSGTVSYISGSGLT